MADLMIWYPIGTLAEIDAIGLPRNTTASCSLQVQGNRGCSWYRKCRFREIRDGATPKGHKQPLKGPENVAVYVQLSQGQGGAADIMFMSCDTYYVSGLHQRQRHMIVNEVPGAEVVKVLGIAGDVDPKTGQERTYLRREQVKAHLVKDPNCADCATNTCIRMKTRTGSDGKAMRSAIMRFPRPNESLQDIALGAEIGREIRAEVEQEMEREALGMHDLADIAQEPEEVVGTGKARNKS